MSNYTILSAIIVNLVMKIRVKLVYLPLDFRQQGEIYIPRREKTIYKLAMKLV